MSLKTKTSQKLIMKIKFWTKQMISYIFSDQSLDWKATFFTGGRLTELETVSVSMLQVHLVYSLLESELISENKGEQGNFLRALVMSLVL